MWFTSAAEISRKKRFTLKKIKKNVGWNLPVSPYGNDLAIDPLMFVYAAMRASIVGYKIGLRGQIAGALLGAAALAYLYKPKSNSSSTADRIRLHWNAHSLKDFVGTGMKGTIGAALAYLEMQDLGYVWKGHWEDCINGSASGAHPDFVFASSTDVCLVDAKGSSSGQVLVEKTAKNEWTRQIRPNLGTVLRFGGTATEGMVIAADLASSADVSLISTYGRLNAATSPATPPAKASASAIAAVQRANLINVCFLLGCTDVAFSLLRGGNASGLSSFIKQKAPQALEGGGDVIIGPVRLSVPSQKGIWLVRPFARVHMLEAMASKFSGDTPSMSVDIPQFNLIVPRIFEENWGEEKQIVQSRDGVGVIFSHSD